MKWKLCVLTALSLAGLALCAAPSSAGWLCHHHCCNHSTITIECRPYNAFSPPCCTAMYNGSLPLGGGDPNLPAGVAMSPVFNNPLLGLNHDMAGINGVYPQAIMMSPPVTYPQQMPTNLQTPVTYPQQMPTNLQTQVPMGFPMQPTGYNPAYRPMVPQQPGYYYGN